MTKIWKSEISPGNSYQFIFTKKDDKRAVKVHEVTSKRWIGSSTSQTGYDPFPVETRDLPLERHEAEDLIERYLSDIHPEEKKMVVERLCVSEDSPDLRHYK